jgi:SAM-dependent methyltransferase
LELADALTGQRDAKNIGVEKSCTFVAGDITALPVESQFDAVLNNEVLHMLDPAAAESVLETAADMTKRGGIHITSGYVIDPDAANKPANPDRYLMPGELQSWYQGRGWKIRYSEDQMYRSRLIHGKRFVDSLSCVVAENQSYKTFYIP